MKSRIEYAPVWILIQVLRFLPRPLARAMCTAVAVLLYAILPRLRQVGFRNLELALPEKSERDRRRILRGVYVSLGRLLSEIPRFSAYTRENVGRIAIYDGFENFERARTRGKGVLFLTAHLGGWEIGSFVHSLHGNPLHVVMRALDNPYIDAYTRNLRTLHGNTLIDKDGRRVCKFLRPSCLDDDQRCTTRHANRCSRRAGIYDLGFKPGKISHSLRTHDSHYPHRRRQCRCHYQHRPIYQSD